MSARHHIAVEPVPDTGLSFWRCACGRTGSPQFTRVMAVRGGENHASRSNNREREADELAVSADGTGGAPV
jgi:hypothetical protein